MMYNLLHNHIWRVCNGMKFKIVITPDSFKGTMSSLRVISIVKEAALRHFPEAEIVEVPIADGGEGTVEALVTACKGVYREAEVLDPLGRPVRARYGIIKGNIAVIEMAEASGLPLLKENERNPLIATTFGTGQLIKAAMDEGIRDFIIGIGGSATNDGGVGALQALGISFKDYFGREIGFGGVNLKQLSDINLDNVDKRISESRFTVMCDVSNPLTGLEGCSHVYGPQKGADAIMIEQLEEAMINYRSVIKKIKGIDVDEIPGAGAAGGMGAGLVAFLNAVLKPGIDTILDIVDFDSVVKDASLVITGEGRIDEQSAYGKVPVGIAKRAKIHGVCVIALCGSMGKNASKVYDCGIDSIMCTVNKDMTLQEALSNAEYYLQDASDRLMRFLKTGMKIALRE